MSPDLWGNWMNPFDDGPESPGDITRNGSADYTHTLTPTTVLNLRWGVARHMAFACLSVNSVPNSTSTHLDFRDR